MSWTPQHPAEQDLTPVTVLLPADMLAKLEAIIDTCQRTHPGSEANDITDLVMRAGIEAIDRSAAPPPKAAPGAAHHNDAKFLRDALRHIAAMRPGAGNSKLHQAVEIARSALQHTEQQRSAPPSPVSGGMSNAGSS